MSGCAKPPLLCGWPMPADITVQKGRSATSGCAKPPRYCAAGPLPADIAVQRGARYVRLRQAAALLRGSPMPADITVHRNMYPSELKLMQMNM